MNSWHNCFWMTSLLVLNKRFEHFVVEKFLILHCKTTREFKGTSGDTLWMILLDFILAVSFFTEFDFPWHLSFWWLVCNLVFIRKKRNQFFRGFIECRGYLLSKNATDYALKSLRMSLSRTTKLLYIEVFYWQKYSHLQHASVGSHVA